MLVEAAVAMGGPRGPIGHPMALPRVEGLELPGLHRHGVLRVARGPGRDEGRHQQQRRRLQHQLEKASAVIWGYGGFAETQALTEDTIAAAVPYATLRETVA